MRKLVSIRGIKELLPIKGADFIEIAIVDGWQVIVKKGEFNVKDSCVFFEIDSFLPVEEQYEFLGKTQEHQGKVGYRLKTLKLRKTLSQGLALPIKLFPQLVNSKLGDDVTDLLGVTKYDNSVREVNGADRVAKKRRSFPSFLQKTDQERIQNLMSYFHILKDMEFEETLKLDGSSCTMYKNVATYTMFERIKNAFKWDFTKSYIKFGVTSRNLELHLDKPSVTSFKNGEKTSEFKTSDFWKVAIKYAVEDKLPNGYAIQGELIGTKIQSNHEKVEELEYYIFDVYNIREQKYLNPRDRVAFLEAHGMADMHIPIIKDSIKLFQECTTLEEVLERVNGESMNKGVISEGRVYKSVEDGHKTFKVINNKFLLKNEK